MSRAPWSLDARTSATLTRPRQHEAAIAALVQANIIDGDADGTFRPDESIRRAETASIIARPIDLFEDDE